MRRRTGKKGGKGQRKPRHGRTRVESVAQGPDLRGLSSSERDIVHRIERRPGASADDLHVDFGGDVEEFRRTLASLERRGHIVFAPNTGWDVPHRTPFRVGRVRIDRRGNAVVRPADRRESDVHVRNADRRGAMAGDTALVRLGGRRGRHSDGSIVRVLERGSRPLRGQFRRIREGGIALVEEGRRLVEVFLPEPPDDLEDGDPVLVRLTVHRSAQPRGVVLVSLVDEGTLETDIEIIRAEFGLPGAHDEEMEAIARRCDAPSPGPAPKGRRDLRSLTVITIDPEDAKDFDDAISLERLDGGKSRLGVHIADVSHYVPSGSELDEVAAERGTSIYLPGRVIPMLPHRLADDVCSLRPDEDRFTKTVFLTFSSAGRLESTEVVRSVIRSARRFTYEEVQRILDRERDDGIRDLPEDWKEHAETLWALSKLRQSLGTARRERGALALDIPKLRLETDDRGDVVGLGREERDPSHELIEEFMLAANEAVARFLSEKDLPVVGRRHPPPDEERLDDFRRLLEACEFEFHGSGTSQDIQRLVADIAGSPMSPAIQLALLRTMGHAEYIAGIELHFALATEHYCHFTSPIRRYPDLLVHQVLDDLWDGRLNARRVAWWNERLEGLAQSCSDLERRAESAERAMVQLRLVRYLEPMLGEEMVGRISSVQKFGFFVQAEETLLEGLVHVATLGGDYYHWDDETWSLRGRRRGTSFRLGDRVLVELSDLDPEAREISFRFVRKLPADDLDRKSDRRAGKHRERKREDRRRDGKRRR